MTPRPTPPAGLRKPHNTMLVGPGGGDWDDPVYRAYCRCCDWSVNGITYYRAVDAALNHETRPEVPA